MSIPPLNATSPINENITRINGAVRTANTLSPINVTHVQNMEHNQNIHLHTHIHQPDSYYDTFNRTIIGSSVSVAIWTNPSFCLGVITGFTITDFILGNQARNYFFSQRRN